MTEAVTLRAVGKRLGGNPVLDAVDLGVPSGSITAVLGPSGSGKTTLLRLIAGLERADAGCVCVAGTVVDDGRRFVDARRRGVGYVPQDAGLFPHLSARANIAFGVSRAEAGVAAELLEQIGLAGLGDRRPHQLSGGQQQRVALARALAIRPPLVLLDEPFAALDATLRADLRRDVAAVLQRTATAAVLVTHDQDEALAMSDAVALLDDGRIIARGDPVQLYRRPPTVAAGLALGTANLLLAEVVDDVAWCGLGAVALDGTPSFAGPARLLLRPEQIAPASDASGIPARVVRLEPHGYDVLAELEIAGPQRLLARLPGDARMTIGSRLSVVVVGPGRAWSTADAQPPREGSARVGVLTDEVNDP
jgi:iron(III) transport system ATP-binding protein